MVWISGQITTCKLYIVHITTNMYYRMWKRDAPKQRTPHNWCHNIHSQWGFIIVCGFAIVGFPLICMQMYWSVRMQVTTCECIGKIVVKE